MTIGKWQEKLRERELLAFSVLTAMLMLAAAFLFAAPEQLAEGMRCIIVSRDALITDYFELAGYGASFLNGALVMGIAIGLLTALKIPFTGLTMAALWINAGYALWGKNPLNMLPIILGTALYAKVHHSGMGRYVYTALFGTCLGPFVTEMIFLLPFSGGINVILAAATGIFIGFILPPLAMHTAAMHMGYNLFNVGFAAGILAFVMVCVLRSLGFQSEPVLLWKAGRHPGITAGLFVYFMAAILLGLWITGGEVKGLWRIMRHPGRAVADFVLMDGAGATLINMGLVGLAGTFYILAVDGDFSGPVLGALLTAFGFAAFGVHLKNYLPVLAGVFLSAIISHWNPATPGSQLAAIFAVGLAPIAGQFGAAAGVAAGLLHAAIVMCTSDMYGGLNLYNNGFSAGWVAIVMVPMMESMMKRFEDRKPQGKKSRKRREERTRHRDDSRGKKNNKDYGRADAVFLCGRRGFHTIRYKEGRQPDHYHYGSQLPAGIPGEAGKSGGISE